MSEAGDKVRAAVKIIGDILHNNDLVLCTDDLAALGSLSEMANVLDNPVGDEYKVQMQAVEVLDRAVAQAGVSCDKFYIANAGLQEIIIKQQQQIMALTRIIISLCVDEKRFELYSQVQHAPISTSENQS